MLAGNTVRHFQLAEKLLKNGFQPIFYYKESKELWLKKKVQHQTVVIRLISQTFNWKNQLRQDSLQAYMQFLEVRKHLGGLSVKFLNTYVATEQPVDEWEDLKEPFANSNKSAAARMFLYYIDEEDGERELARLADEIEINLEGVEASADISDESYVNQVQQTIIEKIQRMAEERNKLFSNGKPLFTYILIALNVLCFILQLNKGTLHNIQNLIDMGANFNPLIIEGEWWRFFSSMFLHLDFFHVAMNMIALFYLGNAVEKIFGRMRFLLIYFLAGLSGSIASFAFSVNVSAGASGAIFGLFGALLFFGLIHREVFKETIGTNIIIILIINFILGFSVSSIDMGAHVGGLVGGFLISAVLFIPGKRNATFQVLGLAVWLVMCISIVNYGWSHVQASPEYKLHLLKALTNEREYQEVIDLASESIEEVEDEAYLPQFLFQRSYAYIQLFHFDLASADLEEAITYPEIFPELYFNLAVIYDDQQKDATEIKEVIDEGLEKFPDDEGLQELKRELSFK